jgi:hypothetical protein
MDGKNINKILTHIRVRLLESDPPMIYDFVYSLVLSVRLTILLQFVCVQFVIENVWGRLFY